MANNEQRILDVGAACLLASADFVEGHCTGWLQFYDERYLPRFPLSSETVCAYLFEIINDTRFTDSWKAGCLVGWIEALCENSPQTFRSVLAGEHLSVVSEVSQ